MCSFPAASGPWMICTYLVHHPLPVLTRGGSGKISALSLFSSTACSVEPRISLPVPQCLYIWNTYIWICPMLLQLRYDNDCFLCFSTKSYSLACRNVVRDRSTLSTTCSIVTNMMTNGLTISSSKHCDPHHLPDIPEQILQL